MNFGKFCSTCWNIPGFTSLGDGIFTNLEARIMARAMTVLSARKLLPEDVGRSVASVFEAVFELKNW